MQIPPISTINLFKKSHLAQVMHCVCAGLMVRKPTKSAMLFVDVGWSARWSGALSPTCFQGDRLEIRTQLCPAPSSNQSIFQPQNRRFKSASHSWWTHSTHCSIRDWLWPRTLLYHYRFKNELELNSKYIGGLPVAVSNRVPRLLQFDSSFVSPISRRALS
jgi:hypothetical protein